MSPLIPCASQIPPWLLPTYQAPGGNKGPISVRVPINMLMGANPDLTLEQAQELVHNLKRSA